MGIVKSRSELPLVRAGGLRGRTPHLPQPNCSASNWYSLRRMRPNVPKDEKWNEDGVSWMPERFHKGPPSIVHRRSLSV